MNNVLNRPFKYRGKKFLITENNLDFMQGFRFNACGFICVSVSRNLSKSKRQLELHRLITGRGLRDI